ncbi:hypothetical protein C7974DRAFT_414159 [Boeremia exigua]|uniref:uncharacterized protein n=1 Tax=Boeremia exigua TaxID=749465 RepID=UPI001E8E3EBF|nr:uncharacterized protein C7974DRAFT_414159 [Boeremia exigua]KAH6625660.1 hypothetical protein C7974DRAFT_414159 [Boeremia exigua]
MATNDMVADVLSIEEFPAYLKTQKNLSRYDPSVERRPDHPWYQVEQARIDELLKEFAQAVVDLLKGPAVKVALLGAQGAGKSLGTNAIFDCDGLSLTGADGAACTSSITRYVGYRSGGGGGNRYFAEIKFLDAEKCRTLLEEHARSYYQRMHADDDSDDEDAKKDGSGKDDEMDVRLSDTALDVFTTLFGSKNAFLEHWSREAYLNKEFVRICKLKCEEALQNEGADRQRVVVKSAENQHALVEQLKPFLTKIPDVNCLWPLVDNITVNFNNDLLSAGLEIIDLPGWGDLNLSRARHAEEISHNVDAVIILTDTIRITTEDKLINSIRAAVAHHGASKVKIVATKIDAINKNQLSQYKGGIYDEIKRFKEIADKEESLLENADDLESLIKKDMISKYISYLVRATLQAKVTSRVKGITNDFAAKLQGRTTKELPQVFHTSASEYMEWIKPDRINFKDQPSLPVEMTGIPAIRQFLYTLPAEQNLKDYEDHIYNILPAFLDRIERTVTVTDRDGGFTSISEDFSAVRKPFMTKTLSGVKAKFQIFSQAKIATLTLESLNYKEHVQDLLLDWSGLKAPAFNRILKNRGLVPKGLSKARGLEQGADWNRDLAVILAPAFQKWIKEHQERMRNMLPSLAYAFDKFYHKIIRVMNASEANVPTVEKAKLKWAPLRTKMLVKLESLMDEVNLIQSKTFDWAIMDYDRQNSLISEVTDSIYIEVFNTAPALKPINPNAKKQSKQYVTPKLKFQMNRLNELFLQPGDHFVDRVINHFQSRLDKDIRHILDKHFGHIEKLFDEFNDKIRAQGPIRYQLRADGEAIRADVQERIPELQARIDQLVALLPARVSSDEKAQDMQVDDIDVKEEDDFAAIHDRVAKRTKHEPPVGGRLGKRVKQEHL